MALTRVYGPLSLEPPEKGRGKHVNDLEHLPLPLSP